MIVLWYLFITTALLCMFLYLLSESGINLCFYPCWRCLDDTQLACCYLHNNYVCVWVCLSREYSRLKRTWAKGNWREIILSTVWAPVPLRGVWRSVSAALQSWKLRRTLTSCLPPRLSFPCLSSLQLRWCSRCLPPKQTELCVQPANTWTHGYFIHMHMEDRPQLSLIRLHLLSCGRLTANCLFFVAPMSTLFFSGFAKYSESCRLVRQVKCHRSSHHTTMLQEPFKCPLWM